jgi:hypothetical protein
MEEIVPSGVTHRKRGAITRGFLVKAATRKLAHGRVAGSNDKLGIEPEDSPG